MDISLFNFLHNFAGRWLFLDWLTIFFAEYLQYFLVVLVFGFWFFGKDKKLLENRLAALTGFISAGVARLLLVEPFRLLYFRPRPFVALNFGPLFDHANESSFPSGHAATFFALATGVYFYNKKLGVFLYLAAFGVGLARIIGGVHWPSDILAGALLGVFAAILVRYFFEPAIVKLFNSRAGLN